MFLIYAQIAFDSGFTNFKKILNEFYEESM